MQIKINLLPPEIQAQLQNKRRQRIIGFVGATILFFLLGTYLALVVATHNLDQQMAKLQKDRQALQQEIASYKTYQDLQAKTVKTNKLVQTITDSSPNFIELLEGISQTIPYNVWLTELTTSSKTTSSNGDADTKKQSTAVQGEVVLRGNALDHAAVANWLHEMPNISILSNIHLQTTNEEDSNGQPVTRFEIKASLTAGDSTAGQQAKVGEQK